MNEAHRVSSIAWDKFYKNIKIELAKHPSERINVTQMIKMCKEEFDRLIETSPVISDKIVHINLNGLSRIASTTIKYLNLKYDDELVSTSKFRNPWFDEENIQKRIKEKLERERNNAKLREEKLKQYKKKVTDFNKQFFDLNNREPMKDEIKDNMKDVVPMKELEELLSCIEKEKEKYKNV